MKKRYHGGGQPILPENKTADKSETKLSLNLKIIRKLKGYTQQSFSDELGLKRGTYSSYEEGRTEPPIKVFYEICKKLEITMEDALTKKIIISTEFSTVINKKKQ